MDVNVFLVGPPGVGKTRIGRRLAKRLGCLFLDTDQFVEAQCGMTVATLFEERGEAAFRLMERAAIQRCASYRGIVASTGGGAVLSEENRRALADNGWVVHLTASPAALLRRIVRSGRRPLLSGADRESKLRELLDEREPLYRAIAAFELDCDRFASPKLAVDHLIAHMPAASAPTRRRAERPAMPAMPATAAMPDTPAAATAPRTLQVSLGERSYPIHIGSGLLSADGPLAGRLAGRSVLVVSNQTVASRCLPALREALGPVRLTETLLLDGERYKTLGTVSRVYDALVTDKHHRDVVVVALGGGVIGDIAGFAAATYQRGVDFVQVPTTLLAQVDSSVGGKTGVNYDGPGGGKNMVGAFHQPICVLADVDVLVSLPEREFRAGLAEVVKYGLICDAPLFAWLESCAADLCPQAPALLAEAVHRSCANKARLVERDEREAGDRALLNLGHTFAHAIERVQAYRGCLHGEAVAIGMALAARLSEALGWLDAAQRERIERLLGRLGLPVALPAGISTEALLDAMAADKKVRAGRLRLVLLNGIGAACLTSEAPAALLRETLDAAATRAE